MRHRQCQWGASNRITEDQTRRDATKRHATKRRRTPVAGRWDPAGDAMAAGGRGRKPASHPIPGEIKRLIPLDRCVRGGARIPQAAPSLEDGAAYRAPEQIRGEEPDVRSDVFAYGALLYEIDSGKRAFPGVGAELNQTIPTQSPAPLPAKSAMPAAMEEVIAGCLEKDPAHRHQRVQNAAIELKLAGRRLPRSAECKFTAARTAIPRMSSRSLQPGVCRACDAPTARAVFNGRVTRRPKERGGSGEESGDDAWWKPQDYVKLTC